MHRTFARCFSRANAARNRVAASCFSRCTASRMAASFCARISTNAASCWADHSANACPENHPQSHMGRVTCALPGGGQASTSRRTFRFSSSAALVHSRITSSVAFRNAIAPSRRAATSAAATCLRASASALRRASATASRFSASASPRMRVMAAS